jgi:hypothetical protein
MNDLTAEEMEKVRDDLEASAATILGRMLFEFGRLDVTLSACVVWLGHGQQIEALTKRFEDSNFNDRLEYLATVVEKSTDGRQDVRTAYGAWIDDAHAARNARNRLAHGRWWIYPYTAHAVNVSGLPTSPKQAERRYTLDELREVLQSFQQLATRLNRLRKKWPL